MNVKNFLKWILLINVLFISNVHSSNKIDSIKSINEIKWLQKKEQHIVQNNFFLKKSYQILK